MIDVSGKYYINLSHRVDRKNSILKEFDKYGINGVTRFEAMTYEEFGGCYDKSVGCALSHLGVLLKAYDTHQSHIWVMEDDCEFIEEHITFYNFSYINELVKWGEYDIFHLGGWYFNNINVSAYNAGVDHMICGNVASTESYILNVKVCIEKFCEVLDCDIDLLKNSRAFVSKYNNLFTHAPLHIKSSDGMLEKILTRRYISNPLLCYQRSGYSDIQSINKDSTKNITMEIYSKINRCQHITNY